MNVEENVFFIKPLNNRPGLPGNGDRYFPYSQGFINGQSSQEVSSEMLSRDSAG
jgi:hypothetical protein